MKFNKRKKFVFFLILIIIYQFFFFLYKSFNLKIAICTLAKEENLYIKEYVDYYKKLGVNHIFIYDNNDENKEKIDDIIGKSYKDFVTIYRNKKGSINNQSVAYTTCYNNNNKKFDWIFMNDIDEFLVIKNDTLKNYLSNKIFQQCDFIKINLIQPTDNNLLYYKNKSLFERFKGPYKNSIYFKSFVKGNIKGLQYLIDSPSSSIRNISCNNIGKKYNFINELFYNNNTDKAYIIHYKYKSTEEFINKLRKDYNKWFDFNFLSKRIEEYFKENELSLEKVEYIEEQLKLNLSLYKKNFLSINKNKEETSDNLKIINYK